LLIHKCIIIHKNYNYKKIFTIYSRPGKPGLFYCEKEKAHAP